jgi:hypothetical protein
VTKPYKTSRAVVELRVPQDISEKKLVWHLKGMLKWPLQLGNKGDHSTLFRPTIKSFSKVVAAERRREADFLYGRRRSRVDVI